MKFSEHSIDNESEDPKYSIDIGKNEGLVESES